MENKLSVIVPVYNEKNTILEIIRKIKSVNFPKEIIVVDDASTDGTRELLKTNFPSPLRSEVESASGGRGEGGLPTDAVGGEGEVTVFYHPKNMGKGAAIRTALPKCSGNIILIQDADLEYDPRDYPLLLEPILDGRADVVYGSRFLGGPHRVLFFWHYFGNRLFTLMTNILYNINFTDMGTCYKVFRAEILKSLNLKSNRFGFEPEVTAKICKRKLRIYETPVSYSGRTYAQGKKITWRDSFDYFGCLLRYRFLD